MRPPRPLTCSLSSLPVFFHHVDCYWFWNRRSIHLSFVLSLYKLFPPSMFSKSYLSLQMLDLFDIMLKWWIGAVNGWKTLVVNLTCFRLFYFSYCCYQWTRLYWRSEYVLLLSLFFLFNFSSCLFYSYLYSIEIVYYFYFIWINIYFQ